MLPEELRVREIEAEYQRNSSTPEGIHASIEDYRASGSIDLKHDAADIAAGRKINSSILAIWAAGGTVDKLFPALDIWRQEGPHVSGKALAFGTRSRNFRGLYSIFILATSLIARRRALGRMCWASREIGAAARLVDPRMLAPS